MKKRVLIISPYFPPSNAADMQRIRMSLPYFAEFGWEAEVVTVHERYSDLQKDPLLLAAIPQDIVIHYVRAFPKHWTSGFGIGSLAIRSLPFFFKRVNQLLNTGKYDLIYFSTTQYILTILGTYWKKKFGVPFIIDMQDPWHSEYYRDKPKEHRPKKHWFSYRLNKYLEPLAMKEVGGLISVSDNYIQDVKTRYKIPPGLPCATITFGVFPPDFEVAAENQNAFPRLLKDGRINIVYIGRGGKDMSSAVRMLFEAFNYGKTHGSPGFQSMMFYFIGTSYAPKGTGVPTIFPLAEELGIGEHVIEVTDRIGYYHALATLLQADALFVPGSDDPAYTASKIYPYLLCNKPLLTIFNRESSVNRFIAEQTMYVNAFTFPAGDRGQSLKQIYMVLSEWCRGNSKVIHVKKNFNAYHARTLTMQQAELFNMVVC